MSFSENTKSNNCDDTKYISYDDDNLSFLWISNINSSDSNFVLFKSRFANNNVYIEDRIINLINNYNFMSYKNTKLYYSDFKFINIDDLINNMIGKLSENDQLTNNLDITINIKPIKGSYVYGMTFVFNVYNTEIALNITSDFQDSQYIQQNKNLTFKDSVKHTMLSISKKLYDILSNIYKIDFEKINRYITFLDMSGYYNHTDFLKKLKYSYNNFKISYFEILEFNSIYIDFDEVDDFCYKHDKEFLQFIKIISSPENILSMLKLMYRRYVMRDNKDSYGNVVEGLSQRYGNLTIHVPLLNSYFTYNPLKITENYINYCNIESKIFKKIIKIYFYIYKKSGIFEKFKDQYEKIILK